MFLESIGFIVSKKKIHRVVESIASDTIDLSRIMRDTRNDTIDPTNVLNPMPYALCSMLFACDS